MGGKLYTKEEKQLYLSIIYQKLQDGVMLAPICRALGLPVETVEDWRGETDEATTSFARARKAGYDFLAQDCLRVSEDTKLPVDRAKLIIETRLKLLARLDPETYGEVALLRVQHQVGDGQPSTAEEFAALMQAALWGAGGTPVAALPGPVDADFSEVDE